MSDEYMYVSNIQQCYMINDEERVLPQGCMYLPTNSYNFDIIAHRAFQRLLQIKFYNRRSEYPYQSAFELDAINQNVI